MRRNACYTRFKLLIGVRSCETVELGAQVSFIQQDGQATHGMLDAILSDNSRARERDAALSANVDRTHAGVQAMDLRVMEVLARVSGLQAELRAVRAQSSPDTRADVQSIRASMHVLDTSLMGVLDCASSSREGARASRAEPVQSRRHTPSASADVQMLGQSIGEVLQTLRDIQGMISATQRSTSARVVGESDLPLQKRCPWCNETALRIGATQTYIWLVSTSVIAAGIANMPYYQYLDSMRTAMSHHRERVVRRCPIYSRLCNITSSTSSSGNACRVN